MRFFRRTSRTRRGGGGRADGWALRRLLDDTAAWSIPVGRLLGVRIRIHALLLMLAAAELLRSTLLSDRETASGLTITATALLALLLATLAHEIGRALMTRWMGGAAETIVLWPLGGLSEHQQPAAWRRRLLASCGGLLLSFVLAFAIWPVLLEQTPNWYNAVTDPFNPGRSYGEWVLLRGRPAWWLSLLWWIGYANLIVFAANLLPVHPLDGAGALESAMSGMIGPRRARTASIALALLLASVIVFVALFAQQIMGVFLGGFALLCCISAARRHAFLAEQAVEQSRVIERSAPDLLPEDVDDFITPAPRSVSSLETTAFPVRLEASPETRKRVAPSRPAASDRLPSEEEVLDRILAKISAEGLGGLTEQERKILESVTARRRRG